VKKIILSSVILSLFIFQKATAQFETGRDSVVQLYGIVMTADSLKGIPAVSIVVKGQNRGTITNGQGVFSIVVMKGDEVEFTHVSYKTKLTAIPKNLEGNQYSVVQLMVEDTVYLPAFILKPRPTPQQFARDFVNTKVPDDNIEIARQNTSAAKRRVLQFRNLANKATYYGQSPPINLFNPAAWQDFIQAWKRGDFKNKN
jgi:hypothetical protein